MQLDKTAYKKQDHLVPAIQFFFYYKMFFEKNTRLKIRYENTHKKDGPCGDMTKVIPTACLWISFTRLYVAYTSIDS